MDLFGSKGTALLVEAILSLKSEAECRAFLEDIMTGKEIQDCGQRLLVAQLLSRKLVYSRIADITGAYLAGVVLSNLQDAPYIERKMDINSYIIFGPLFFASIGLSTDVGEMDTKLMLFTLVFVVVALLSKIVGCGGMARLCGFNNGEALKIGVGMMNRGEVALIVAQKGLALGLLNSMFFTSVIILILISAIVTPVVLKLLYQRDEKKGIVEA